MAQISVAGRVIKSPEVRFFDSGTSVCRISIADRAYVRPERKGEEAPGQFYDLEVWGKAGEIAADRLTKGSRIAAFGQGVWREYQTKDGKTQRAYVVRVPSEGMTYMDTKAEAEALKGTTAGSAPAPGGDEIPF